MVFHRCVILLIIFLKLIEALIALTLTCDDINAELLHDESAALIAGYAAAALALSEIPPA